MLELKYKDYLNKVHGGWIGKCIGGAVGAMQENNKSLMDYSIDNVFPEVIPPNDDLDLQILWLQEILEKKGSVFTSDDLAKAFARYNLEIVNEYAIAIKNIELGIMPPMSGIYNNTFFKASMGCPIRSEIWGFICPGSPEAAVRFAQLDGSIDHDTESINGEKFLAALEAMAFFENDVKRIIQSSLQYIPDDSRLSKCIGFISEQYINGIPWRNARDMLVKKFGSADASYSVINIGIAVMALLYGKSDFSDTLLIAVNSGFDTDCTAATAGAILGLILGAGQIPESWKNKIGKEIIIGTVDIRRYSNLISNLAKDTCAAGLALIRDGKIPVRVLGLPADLKLAIPLPAHIPDVEIQVEYLGKPAIGYDEKSNVIMIIKNNSNQEQKGIVHIETPAYMETDTNHAEIVIGSNSVLRQPIVLNIKKDTVLLPQRNIVDISFLNKDGDVAKREFGLAGAFRMKMLGPFFDNYDTGIYDADPYNGRRQQHADGSLDLFAMFNGFVDINRPYIDEAFDYIDSEEFEYVNFKEDKLEIEEKITYNGPCCVYLVYDFICPEEIDDAFILIGNNDSYKLWLNGELVAYDFSKRMWMPFNNRAQTRIRSGSNRMIIKVIRSGDSFEFSLLIGSSRYRDHFLVNLSSLIER